MAAIERRGPGSGFRVAAARRVAGATHLVAKLLFADIFVPKRTICCDELTQHFATFG
jgi:hypothetical protein